MAVDDLRYFGCFQNTAGAVTDYEAYPDAGAAGIYGCHLSACVTTVTLGVNGVSSGTGSLASGSNIGLLGVFGLGIDPSHAGTGTFAGDPIYSFVRPLR
jgi:hypothetical protein